MPPFLFFVPPFEGRARKLPGIFRCPGVVRTTQAPPVKEKIFGDLSPHAAVNKSD